MFNFPANGHYSDKFPNGKTMCELNFVNTKMHGEQLIFHSDGILRYRIYCEYGKKHGLCESFHPNGKYDYIHNYLNSKQEGKQQEFNKNGDLVYEYNYLNHKLFGPQIEYDSSGSGLIRSYIEYDSNAKIIKNNKI